MHDCDNELWQAVLNKDSGQDGQFFYGVLTTGVYCQPSCAARTPLRKNVRFYVSQTAAQADGLRACKRCRPDTDRDATKSLMHDMCRYIAEHSQQRLTLALLAEQAGMSASHFQRMFTGTIGMSPKKYQDSYRIRLFKNSLKGDRSNPDTITGAMHSSGYESSSRLYEKIDTHMGMTPSTYRKGGAGELISYASAETSLGLVMIGATDRGICFLQFDDTEDRLLAQLGLEYPKASFQPMPLESQPLFDQWIAQLNEFLQGRVRVLDLPIDIRGTAFQCMVWDYLVSIPSGTLQSYTEVANGIGKPKAVRAVASACANNKIAIRIPCHRVIRGDGSLAGYKWGLARKRSLIDLERRVLVDD
ncbi:bifunctional DNA-binding transcriptional regulator/O6-methylguanine-DNA methyltransferase Ada [Porticoccaceae bacterium]|nr:bifunctional DNA-binding transcriptional regulator/O6-methylguanine-DNA methyltransferase Ada [Porticoccaceae bacterium]